MAELQEVQITEEKPLLPGQTPEVAKVIRDPLTPRPEFQTFRQPPHSLPSQIHDLRLTTPLLSPRLPAFLSPYTTTESPGFCPVTTLTFILSVSLFVNLFLSLVSVGLFTYLSLSVSVSPSDSAWLCVSVCICPCVSFSRRLS